jgi:hypothetical protein
VNFLTSGYRRSNFIVGIAILAILLNSFIPVMSHIRFGDVPLLQEICSSFGKRLVPVTSQPGAAPEQAAVTDNGKKNSPNSNTSMGTQCLYCQVHAAQLGLPPSDLSLSVPFIAGPFIPPLYFFSSSPLFVWAAKRARGPPVFS